MKQEEINIREVFNNIPKGHRLYSPVCGFVKVIETNDSGILVQPVESAQTDDDTLLFRWNGRLAGYQDYDWSECVLFPSRLVRKWDVFTWKEGDVLEGEDGKWLVVFDSFEPGNGVERFSAHFVIKNPGTVGAEFHQHFKYFVTSKFFNRHHTAMRLQTLRHIEQNYLRPINLYTYELHPTFKKGDFIVLQVSYDDPLCVHEYVAIFNEYNLPDRRVECFASLQLRESDSPNVPDELCLHIHAEHIKNITLRFADYNEQQQLLSALRADGLRWDENSKEIVATNNCEKEDTATDKVIAPGEFKPFDKVLVRDTADEVWQPALFSWELKGEEYCYGVAGGMSEPVFYRQCISFNDKTAHLVGTSNPYKEEE